jgi:DNA-binding XRE family transcriptional regulator
MEQTSSVLVGKIWELTRLAFLGKRIAAYRAKLQLIWDRMGARRSVKGAVGMPADHPLLEELRPNNFPRNLRALRVLRGLEQRDLAQRAGVGADTISHLENGRNKPRAGTIKKLADALDVPPEKLVGHSG